MVFYRPQLQSEGVVATCDLLKHHPPQWIAIAGIVICRQRPGSAKGVFFMTLEDEFGMVNVAVMPNVFEKHRALLSTSSALIMKGPLERQQDAISVLGKSFWALSPCGPDAHMRSRDFH